jgi:hypothetical protein
LRAVLAWFLHLEHWRRTPPEIRRRTRDALRESLMPQVSLEVVLLTGCTALLVASFAIATVACTRWRRAAQRATALTTEQMSHSIERLTRLENLIIDVDARLASLAVELATTHAKPAPSTSPANYQIAIRLARSGAPREQLVSNCGLSQQEAELVARLHGPDKRQVRTASHAA